MTPSPTSAPTSSSTGAIYFHRLEWSRYPHIVQRHGDHVWTSVHLALRKPP